MKSGIYGMMAAVAALGVAALLTSACTEWSAKLDFTGSGFDISGTVGTDIEPVDVSGGVSGGTPPYMFSATGLPEGLVIDRNTGVISGKPTAAATGKVTVTVTDSAGNTASITIDISIKAAGGEETVTVTDSAGASASITIAISIADAPQPAAYTITYDGNGAGSGTAPAVETVTEGSVYTVRARAALPKKTAASRDGTLRKTARVTPGSLTKPLR